MNPTLSIASIRVHPQPLTRTDGDLALAHLSLVWGPWLMVGAILLRDQRGRVRVQLPGNSRSYRVRLLDQAMREHLLRLALDAYRGITGRDLAEMPVAKAPQTIEVPS